MKTLVEHPASMTHASMPPEDHRAAGFSDGLVRYSVGLEDVWDLIADLRQALDVVSVHSPEALHKDGVNTQLEELTQTC